MTSAAGAAPAARRIAAMPDVEDNLRKPLMALSRFGTSVNYLQPKAGVNSFNAGSLSH